MHSPEFPHESNRRAAAFTLVEMLVVIAIISILMTVGSIGLGNLGGKGVSGGLTLSEAVFDEARTTAISRNVRSCVLVAKTLKNSPAEDLRRIVVAYEEIDEKTGLAKTPDSTTPNWVLSSRPILLPEQTFFSEKFSKKNIGSTSKLDTIEHTRIANVKSSHHGTYFIYQFNSQGICTTSNTDPLVGTSFVIGSGARNNTKSSSQEPPRVTGSGKRDLGGFVIWPNGRTSLYRSPLDIDDQVRAITSGTTF